VFDGQHCRSAPWVGGIVMIVIASIVVQLHGVMVLL
jgi:hypothetical protein